MTPQAVGALPVQSRERIHWDAGLPGFGVRVYPSGTRRYVVQAYRHGRMVRSSIGSPDDMTLREARDKAASLIRRIQSGYEPSDSLSPGPSGECTVADLAERFMREHVGKHLNPRTENAYESLLRNHILPSLGALSIGAVGEMRAREVHHGLRSRPTTANAVLKVLSKMYTLAEYWNLLPPGSNPCRSIRKYRLRARNRFLTPNEYRGLGRALDAAEGRGGAWPHAVAAVRLLLVTGCRRSEILGLRWDDVDAAAGQVRLGKTKTGTRMLPLTTAFRGVLASIPRAGGNPWVIAGRAPGAPMRSISHYWHRIRDDAGLHDVRLHDLRHSYASRALAMGENMLTIGKLLGHNHLRSTHRYAHLPQDAEGKAAARVGDSIGAHLD